MILETFRKYKNQLIALTGLLVLISSAKAVDENGELRRKQSNTDRLARMSPSVQPKVKAVIGDLEAHGHRPLIDAAVWRSPAEQAALVKKGVSTVKYSFHTVTTPAGKPDSLAADITDQRWLWNSPKSFWLKLASSAEAHDMTTGIYWGLSTANRNKIHSIIARKAWNETYQPGWDVAHTEPIGITLGQAKAGQRPYGYKFKPKGGAS